MLDIVELGEAGIRAFGFWLWIFSPKYRAQVASQWHDAGMGQRGLARVRAPHRRRAGTGRTAFRVVSPRVLTAYMSSSGRTSHSPSNSGQCSRCSSMKSRATFIASSREPTSTMA